MRPKRHGGLSARLGDLLFGTDERVKLRVRLTFVVMALYGCWLAMLAFIHRLGLIDDTGFRIVAAIDILLPPTFYLLVRSGYTQRFKDSGLVVPQMLVASAATVITYVFCPTMRAALMQCLCMVQVFGLFSLQPAQALRVGSAGALMLAATLLVAPDIGPSESAPNFESLRVTMSGFIVVLLAFASRRYATMRQDVRMQKQELAHAVEQVNELVTRDTLTGLYSRQYMQDMLEREGARLKRSGMRFCIALIDLDHFKRINDNHGHQVGDSVLEAFARATREALRDSDIVARWGGEEFLLFMPATHPEENGSAGVQRLLDHVVQMRPCAAHPDLKFSFSAGIAASSGPDEPLDHLLERADRALYEAKAQGRCRFVLAGALQESSTKPAHEQVPHLNQGGPSAGPLPSRPAIPSEDRPVYSPAEGLT